MRELRAGGHRPHQNLGNERGQSSTAIIPRTVLDAQRLAPENLAAGIEAVRELADIALDPHDSLVRSYAIAYFLDCPRLETARKVLADIRSRQWPRSGARVGTVSAPAAPDELAREWGPK